MGLIEKRYVKIPLEQIEGVDEMFFRQVQMDGQKVMKKFKNLFDETKAEVYERLSSEGILQSFRIEEITDDAVLR